VENEIECDDDDGGKGDGDAEIAETLLNSTVQNH
jgi:hypothetical protein